MNIQTLAFSGQHCPACKQAAPIVAAVLQRYGITAEPVDVHKEPEKASKYNVSSLPTYLLLRDNREVGRLAGAQPRVSVEHFFSRHLGPARI